MHTFFSLVIIHFLAVISPGLEFITIVQNSLSFGAKKTVKLAAGIATGNGIFIAISMLGLSQILIQHVIFNIAFHLLGSGYLLFLALKMLKSGMVPLDHHNEKKSKNFMNGIIRALSNPKSMIFYTFLLGIFIKKDTTYFTQFIWFCWMLISTFIYFMMLALFISKFKKKIFQYTWYLEKIFALVLIFFSAKLFFDTAQYLLKI